LWGKALEYFMSTHPSSRAVIQLVTQLWLTLITVDLAQGESLVGKELIAALRSGGYVILMRHASSPQNPPEAAQADVENVQRERQLDAEGRASTRAMGEALRRLHISIGEVLSSPTYRALQTVKLAQLRRPRTFEELGDGGQSMRADKGGARANWLKTKASAIPRPHENTLIVTHFPNISEAYPQGAVGLADGEALILHPDGRGGATIVAHVKIDEWTGLATAR
jgi:phosphohistidine phosphatase SixA